MRAFLTTRLRFDSFRFIIISICLISLIQPGCGSDAPDEPPPPAVSSVFPEQSSDSALVSTLVTATFRNEMDGSTINTTTFTLTLGGAPVAVASVTYDALLKTATLTPAADLSSGLQYQATISTDVKNSSGANPLTSDHVWSFTISPSMLLISKSSSGVTSNNASKVSDIDASGRYIVFESTATNLTTVPTTGLSQIYRKDTLTGDVVIVSVDESGLVAANNASFNPRISSNGRFVVFESTATNLSSINTGGTNQVFIKNLFSESASVELVSRDVAGNAVANKTASNPVVSNDGSLVAFVSAATNLTAIDNGTAQIYVKNLSDESIEMISRSAANAAGTGNSTNPDMSADGIHIVFESGATNITTPASTSLNHIFYVDTSVAHAVEQISVDTAGAQASGGDSNNPSVSDDGLIVAFQSDATNLDGSDANGLTDIFMRDRSATPSTALVSAIPASGSSSVTGASTNAHISGNGDYVVFESVATNLITPATNGSKHVHVRDLTANPTVDIDRVNNPESGSEATADTDRPAISTDGRYVSFDSTEQHTLDDTDSTRDVFRAHNSTF